MCSRTRGLQVARDLSERCKASGGVRFLTLTLAPRDESLTESLRRLLDCFKRFRSHPKIAPLIAGGARCIEVTRGMDGGHWHPHLHCLIAGKYLPQKLASSVWKEITVDSFIVDVRACHDRGEAARYIASYVAKPTRMRTWLDVQLREYADAIAGIRMVQCWGTWHAAPIDADDKPEPPEETAHVCNLNALHRIARDGSIVARDVMRRLGCLDRSFRIALGLRLAPEEIEDGSRDASIVPRLIDVLEYVDDNQTITAADFDAAIRGPGPLPRDPHRQRIFEWMPAAPPDPSPADVERWKRTEVIGEPWNN